jgi:hypothetical protein
VQYYPPFLAIQKSTFDHLLSLEYISCSQCSKAVQKERSDSSFVAKKMEMDAHRWDKCLNRGGDYVVK